MLDKEFDKRVAEITKRAEKAATNGPDYAEFETAMKELTREFEAKFASIRIPKAKPLPRI